MKLRFYSFSLQFRYPFRIAHGERNSTPVVFVEIEENGLIGYGEAAMPPYLSETVETVSSFLSAVSRVFVQKKITISHGLQEIIDFVNHLEKGNFPAKAAVDIALHDLFGKTNGVSLKKIFNRENLPQVFSTYTLGISNPTEMQNKIAEAGDFRLFKLKLDGKEDKKIVEDFIFSMKKSKTESGIDQQFNGTTGYMAFCVDVNQAWKDLSYAIDITGWLKEKGVIMIEQPFPLDRLDDTAFLTEKSPVPVIADESVQGLYDIEKIKGAFSGINIKLMKCGGLAEAKKMIQRAKELNMKILVGCMSESSCAVTAAAHLTPFADWADLDGPYLIKNDPFEGIRVENGKIVLPDHAGIGLIKKIPKVD